MKIEEGKTYRTRGGRKVGPMTFDGHSTQFPWSERGSVCFWSQYGVVCHGAGARSMDLIAEWTDEPDRPKTYGEMTPEEKGLLHLAEYEGGQIEAFSDFGEWSIIDSPAYFGKIAYRVKPVRETVTLYGRHDGQEWCFGETRHPYDTHTFPMDLIDGKPDCGSIKMEEL